MSEFYLALKMMSESRYKWPMPPERPAVVSTVAPVAPVRKLAPEDAELLREALERGATCVTGKLVKLPDSPLYVPEMKDTPECK